MLRVTLKSLLSRKARMLISGLAVMLAVLAVSGAFVLDATLGKSFDRLFATAYDHTDLQVSATSPVGEVASVPAELDAGTVERVRAVAGVTSARGLVRVDGARVIGSDGKVVPAAGARYGANWTGEDGVRVLRAGTGPRSDDEVVLDAALASKAGVKVGDRVEILTRQPRRAFTVSGIVGYPGGRDSMGADRTVLFTEPVAQELMLGHTGAYTAVDVKVAGGDVSRVRAALRDRLGNGYRVETGKELAKRSASQAGRLLDMITYVLLGFAAVAILVGVFLILNTFSIVVAQRTRELALLRAVGARRGQVVRSVLVESLVVGLVAGGVGFAAGIGVGSLGASMLASSAGDLRLAGLTVPASAIVVSLLVGVGVTMLAALVPAVRASRVPPVAALRETATPERPLTRGAIIGAVVTVLAAVVLALGLTGDVNLGLVIGGVLLAFVGVALLTPLISRPVVRLLGAAFAWSVPGELGRRNSARQPRRTASTAAALMIGIALVTGLSTIFSSVQSSLDSSMHRKMRAQLIISGEQTATIMPTVEEAAVRRIRELGQVRAAAGIAADRATVDGADSTVMAWDDLAAAGRLFKLTATAGRVDNLRSGELMLSESQAKGKGLGVGDRVRVELRRGGARDYTVAGVYADTKLVDQIVVPFGDAEQGFWNPQPVQVFVEAATPGQVPAVQHQIAGLISVDPDLNVLTRDEFLGQVGKAFDIMLMAVQVLLGLAMVIAVLGIVNTLVLAVLERTRELGLLRAVGLRRGQTIRMVTVESVVISLFGAVLGVVVGAVLGTVVVVALRDQGFDRLTLPWGLMITYLVAAVAVGVLAALIPAVRAARLNVLNAIAYQ